VFSASAGEAERRAWRFLVAWIGASFVFFSLSSGKRGLYLLPVLPALALLLADSWSRWIESERRIPRLVHVATAVLGLAVAAAGAWVALRDPLGAAAASLQCGVAAVAIVAAAALVQVGFARARAPLRLRIAVPVVAVWALELVAFAIAYPARDADKSPRAIAEAAAELTPPDRSIGLVGDAAMAGGLAYYADRRVALLRGGDDVAQFFAAGGRAVVVAEKKRDRVESVAAVRVHHRAREGRRAVLVLAPVPVGGS
jgi:hypothetical protein